MFYRHMGELPHKRLVQFRNKDGSLYLEQVMVTKGFSGTQSILYHHYMPTVVGHAALSHSF
ncbi:homogentisate 1,2-dioxygenase, partial [Bacillus tropicus]|nr:homogentisate 1,2-dioxygenase [Bacillus tropicus]